MSLRITYIANVRFPTGKAHGIQIAKMGEAFAGQGADLTLVVPRRGEFADPFAFYGLKTAFTVKRIWGPNIFPRTRLGFLCSTLLFTFSVCVYLFRHHNYDAIYSIDIDHLSFLGVLCGRSPRFFEMHAPRRRTLLNRLWFNNLSGVVTINQTIQAILETNFPALKGNTLVAPNGVDLSRYEGLDRISARKKLGLPEAAKIIVYTGSFQGWKGIETIIKAAKGLEQYHFYFAGGAEKDLKALGFIEPIPVNVHFAGKRDFKEMPLWHVAADILLVTGTKTDEYSYYHTSPMKLFEYLAARRPIVASRTPAILQVVSDQEIFFHTPDDAVDLRRALLAAARNPEAKIEAAYCKAQELSWENRARRVVRFIQDRL